MAIKSLQHSSITDNIFYRSLLAGNTAFEPSDEDILAEQVLSSSAASVTFSGLDAYAADYQHLQIRITALQTGGGGGRLYMRMNDAGSYWNHFLIGTGSTVVSEGFSANGIRATNSLSVTANQFTVAVMDILDPFSTAKNKTVRTLQGNTGTFNAIGLQSGSWASTTAVDAISFATGNIGYGDGGSLAIGSTFTLIGVK